MRHELMSANQRGAHCSLEARLFHWAPSYVDGRGLLPHPVAPRSRLRKLAPEQSWWIYPQTLS